MTDPRRRRPNRHEPHVDPNHWERLLASEGLTPEPERRRMRAKTPDENGRRRWKGPYEQLTPQIGSGTNYGEDGRLNIDPADRPHADLGTQRVPDSDLQAVMETPPHAVIPDSHETRNQRSNQLEPLLLQAISELNDRQYQIAHLRLVANMPFHKIATETNGTREGVRLEWHQIRQQLEQTITRHKDFVDANDD